jgi:cytochrome c oxidase subunit 4
MANQTDNHDSSSHSHHHILPNKVLLGIGGSLLFLTLLTVAVAHIDLGRFNFLIAMAIATLKGTLVALFFMNLWYDDKANAVIFCTSFLFLTIFIVLTSTDIFFRGDVYVKGPLTAPETKSHLKDPWISTPELVEHGHELFMQNCISCHGPEGKGNGPAASALNPPPRNFTSTEGWINGRRPTMIFKTLKEGVAGSAMASFATLPSDYRWALAQYVLTLNPTKPEKDSAADFAKAGVDPNGSGVEKVEPTIPVELAMSRMAVPEAHADEGMAMTSDAVPAEMLNGMSGSARIYTTSCAHCHGANGEGGLKVKSLGVYPVAYIMSQPFTVQNLGSSESFAHVVMTGLPGDVMPGNGQLSGAELRDLYQYVHGLRGSAH